MLIPLFLYFCLSWVFKGLSFVRQGLCLNIYYSKDGAWDVSLRHWCNTNQDHLRIDGSASWQIPFPAASHIPFRSQHRTLPTQSVRNKRVLSAPESTLGWQSPSLSHPICRVSPSLCLRFPVSATARLGNTWNPGQVPSTVLGAEGCMQCWSEMLPGH